MPTITRFRDLNGPYGRLVCELTNGRLTPDDWCHLDPDINQACLPRKPCWRGSLGQEAAAQGHLANQNIAHGDLFLFWGLFRVAANDGRWRFVGPAQHRIWGWLQVGDIVNLGPDGSHAVQSRPWLCDHPHARAGWRARNTLYLAADRLALGFRELPFAGSGVLKRGYRLTADNGLTSRWAAPDWLNLARGGCGMTYNPAARWFSDGTVRSAARGQEFVAAPKPESGAMEWIESVIRDDP
jgi:hypothetical protein